MVQFTFTQTVTKDVRYLKVSAGVRYWEDASVNDIEEDNDAPLMPFIRDSRWEPVIQLDTGRVVDWPSGVEAKIHYKVCDDGTYDLLDGEAETVYTREGYVPRILAPGGAGYGDYIVMKIDGNGQIENWRPDLSDWGEDNR